MNNTGPGQLSISLLGSMQVRFKGEDALKAFRTKKERALMAYLVVETDRSHSRESLAEIFWPDRPMGYARTNLRQALSGVRGAIIDRETAPGFLKVSDETIQFNPRSPYELDCRRFDQLLEATRQHAHESLGTCESCAHKLEVAVSLYQGDFLEEFSIPDSVVFEEWVIIHREHYFRQLLTTLNQLIRYHQGVGNTKKAKDFARQQVNLAPLEESAHRQLMMLLAREGRRSAAMEQYQNCRRILEEELGVDPDFETTALYEKIKSGSAFEGVETDVKQAKTNLPPQFTQFVGREEEIDWFQAAFEEGICRLITIVGMSGVGKTRLAIEVGSKFVRLFPDGVWFVPLSSVQSVDLIADRIVEAMGMNTDDQDPEKALFKHLHNKNALLIIDNFEHLLDGSSLLLQILRQEPDIKILVTSQRRLNFQAACLLQLRGLPYPDFDDRLNFNNYAAVKLFISRANRWAPGLQINDEDIPHLIRICQLVDGLPLGIELAAAGLSHFTCEIIANELSNNLGILNTTMVDIPERHRSMRAAFNYSWEFLSEKERDTYRRLSIFHGEFSLDAALATTGAPLQVLSSLADKSLIQTTSSGRYSIQPLLRQFVSEKLAEFVDSEDLDIEPKQPEDFLVTRDPLTKLPNKILFRDLFHYALARARRNKLYVVLLLLEVDNVDAIYTALGQIGGDGILKALANLLSKTVRESDIVAHLVKGKFAILLENVTDPTAGEMVARKILYNFETSDHPDFDKVEIDLNIGISIYPLDSEDVNKLSQFANQALHRARMNARQYEQYGTATSTV